MAKNRKSEAAVLGSPARGVQLNEAVYGAIKAQILRNKLRPGVKLTHQGLAETLGVSRTPIRESLERLYQEGYVVRIPRRGYFVGEIGEGEVTELYETREALELFFLGRIVKPPHKEQIKSLRKINDQYRRLIGDNLTRERLLVDREFHITLASFVPNGYMKLLLEAVFDRLILKRRIDGFNDSHGMNLYQEHVNLLEALESGDRREASQVLRDHIRGARLRFLKFLQAAEADT